MTSLRNAINAKCRSCIYDPESGCGTWREQVTKCASANCPLHPVRPRNAPKPSPGESKGRVGVVGYTPHASSTKIGPENARFGGPNA